MRIEHSTEIAAPVSEMWKLTLDVEQWPDITPTVTTVERLDDGPMAVGSRAMVKQPGQRRRTWTVTALEPERRFVWSTTMLGTTMSGGHHLAPCKAGTTNTLTVDIEGPLSGLVGRLFRRPIAKAIAAENEGFKTAAQRSNH